MFKEYNIEQSSWWFLFLIITSIVKADLPNVRPSSEILYKKCMKIRNNNHNC